MGIDIVVDVQGPTVWSTCLCDVMGIDIVVDVQGPTVWSTCLWKDL